MQLLQNDEFENGGEITGMVSPTTLATENSTFSDDHSVRDGNTQ